MNLIILITIYIISVIATRAAIIHLYKTRWTNVNAEVFDLFITFIPALNTAVAILLYTMGFVKYIQIKYPALKFDLNKFYKINEKR